MVKGREGAMKRDDLLWILQNDDEIRAAILHIVYGENDVSAETVEQGALLENMSDERPPETEKLQMRLEQVQTRCDALANEKKGLEGQLQQVQADRDVRIKNEEKLQGEKEELSKRLGETEALAREKDEKIHHLEDSLQEEKRNISNLQSQMKKQQEDYEAAKTRHTEEMQRVEAEHSQQLEAAAAMHARAHWRRRIVHCRSSLQSASRAAGSFSSSTRMSVSIRARSCTTACLRRKRASCPSSAAAHSRLLWKNSGRLCATASCAESRAMLRFFGIFSSIAWSLSMRRELRRSMKSSLLRRVTALIPTAIRKVRTARRRERFEPSICAAIAIHTATRS